MQIHAVRERFGRMIELNIAVDRSDGNIDIAKPLAFETIEDGMFYAGAPAVVLSDSQAQLLMDELWNCGVRPSEGSGSAGSLAATERHLGDMQKIAFKLLGEEIDLADQSRRKGAIK